MADVDAPRVAVVGSGYVGTVVAASLAFARRQVVGVEVDRGRLAGLRLGNPPFHEPGLTDLLGLALDSGRLRFTSGVEEATRTCEVIFLCVGTPPRSDGTADTSALESAARRIAGALDDYRVVVTKSTVPMGSADWLRSVMEDSLGAGRGTAESFAVVSNPEFLREGTAIHDFLFPERVVLGSDDPGALDLVQAVYQPILQQSFLGGRPEHRPPLVETTLATAEMVKYAANAFLATKVSFINEIANLCDLVGADVADVATALGLDSRIGDRFLEAGIGWGGSCFGKDLSALVATAAEYGYEAPLLRATSAVNGHQRNLVVERLRRHLKTLKGRRIGLFGVAFKPGTDDTRDAPAVEIARLLLAAGAMVRVHDPQVDALPELGDLRFAETPYEAAEGADAVVLATDWPEYMGLDPVALRCRMRGNVVIDGRNLLDRAAFDEAGLWCEGVGRPAVQVGERATP